MKPFVRWFYLRLRISIYTFLYMRTIIIEYCETFLGFIVDCTPYQLIFYLPNMTPSNVFIRVKKFRERENGKRHVDTSGERERYTSRYTEQNHWRLYLEIVRTIFVVRSFVNVRTWTEKRTLGDGSDTLVGVRSEDLSVSVCVFST